MMATASATAHPHAAPQPHPLVTPGGATRLAAARAARQQSGFVPMLLLTLAVGVGLAFQTAQLLTERQQLAAAQATLDVQLQGATKLRAALDGLATATAKLATEGNANARVVVEELRKRGITINPPLAPATPP